VQGIQVPAGHILFAFSFFTAVAPVSARPLHIKLWFSKDRARALGRHQYREIVEQAAAIGLHDNACVEPAVVLINPNQFAVFDGGT